jgi:hypothetical protein
MFVGIGVGIGRQRFAGGGGGFADSYSARVLADGGTIEALSCVASASALLQTASLLLIPSGYKAGVAYSALPNNGNGDLTWSRNSTANRTQSDGTIGSVGANVPRLSYMYGSCPSLLLEPQRTNLALRSEDFTNTTWIKIASTITSDTTTAPDGSNTADTLFGDGTNSTHEIEQNISVTSGLSYTYSIYAKKNTNNFLQIVAPSGRFGTNVFANYDLNNGVLGSVGTSGNASIQSIGNGWYRCILTGTAIATGSAATYIINLITSSTSPRYESNTLDTSVYLWGAQLEQGAYATTYIPTTTATATRLADTFTRNNIYTNGLISASGGTWFVELKNNVQLQRQFGSTGLSLVTASGDIFANNNGILITNREASNPARIAVVKIIGGTATTLYTTPTDSVKIAVKWNGTTADVFVNGTKVVSATAFTPTTMQFLQCFQNDVQKFIQQMALFNTPLSDSDCQLLTT